MINILIFILIFNLQFSTFNLQFSIFNLIKESQQP